LAENELDKVDKFKIRRSCIPSKDDPPEEMMEWLKIFAVCIVLNVVPIIYFSKFFLFDCILFFYRNGQMQKEC